MATAVGPYKSMFRSPFGDVFGAYFGNNQFLPKCRELELNVVDCTDVYGHKGLLKQCRDHYDDFVECIYEKKQEARVTAMRRERLRQFLSGERSKKDYYAEPPKIDGYFQTYGRSID